MKQRGFTLIETLLYIALLSMLMSGVLVSAYNMVSASQKTDTKNIIQQEGNFVLRKIDWALNGTTVLTAPSAVSPFGTSLDIVSNNGVHTVIRYNAGTKKIEMRENGGAYLPLTTVNASTTSLQFHYVPAVGTSPAGIEASTTIDGMTFYTKRYIRK